MELYLADIGNTGFDRINEISPERRKKTERLIMNDDKKRCITGGLMINKLLPNANISFNDYGKPIADNGRFFNLSHSGEYVLTALSDSEIGCDIQKIKYVREERLAKGIFCQREIDSLKNSFDKLTAFFRLWTRKESLLKCIGTGFFRDGKSVDVCGDIFEENGVVYFMKSYEFSDYVISVCSVKNVFPNVINFLDF